MEYLPIFEDVLRRFRKDAEEKARIKRPEFQKLRRQLKRTKATLNRIHQCASEGLEMDELAIMEYCQIAIGEITKVLEETDGELL